MCYDRIHHPSTKKKTLHNSDTYYSSTQARGRVQKFNGSTGTSIISGKLHPASSTCVNSPTQLYFSVMPQYTKTLRGWIRLSLHIDVGEEKEEEEMTAEEGKWDILWTFFCWASGVKHKISIHCDLLWITFLHTHPLTHTHSHIGCIGCLKVWCWVSRFAKRTDRSGLITWWPYGIPVHPGPQFLWEKWWL